MKQKLKEISKKADILSRQLKKIDNRIALLDAGKNVSDITYELLNLILEHEEDVINMVEERKDEEGAVIFLNKPESE